MNKLLSCEFNIDTGNVELRYADWSMISIDWSVAGRLQRRVEWRQRCGIPGKQGGRSSFLTPFHLKLSRNRTYKICLKIYILPMYKSPQAIYGLGARLFKGGFEDGNCQIPQQLQCNANGPSA